MNKLVIIGNGFDLSHGLPTSYNNFIDNFWVNSSSDYKNDKFRKFVFINEAYFKLINYNEKAVTYNIFKNNLIDYSEEYNLDYSESNHLCSERTTGNIVFKFENNFFKQICIKKTLQNWVDIENEYYNQLKSIVKSEEKIEFKKEQIKVLNKEFAQVENLLEEYLVRELNQKYDFRKATDINFFYNLFKIEYLELKNGKDKYLLEFPKEDYDDLIKFDEKISSYFHGEEKQIKRTTVLLNF